MQEHNLDTQKRKLESTIMSTAKFTIKNKSGKRHIKSFK